MADDLSAAGRAKPKRVRRPTAEVRGLILEAARAAFTERGFAGATTRSIAEQADVAEPLIFSNFGSKAALFAEAVIGPFEQRFREFVATTDAMPSDREIRSAYYVHSIYPFLRTNAGLLHAMLKSAGDIETPPLHALDDFFRMAGLRMREQYAKHGLRFDVSPDLIVRYSFGMLAGAVLFGDWFFPDGAPPEAEAEAALSRMLYKAAEPGPSGDPSPRRGERSGL